jgi:hypothetical protein
MKESPSSAAHSSRAPRLTVGRDRCGRWVVSDRLGLCGGWFVDRATAVHYAMFESAGEPQAVMMAPDVVETELTLDAGAPRRPAAA